MEAIDRGPSKAFLKAVAMLAVFIFLKGLLWAVTIPPLDGPDEVLHLIEAQAASGRSVDRGVRATGIGPDVQTLADGVLVAIPPGQQPSARFYVERVGGGETGALEAAARQAMAAPHTSPDTTSQQGPLTYILYGFAVAGAWADGVIAQLYAARLVSVLLGVGACMAVVWAGRQAGLDRGFALAAGAVVGLQPMWSQQTSVITSDAPALFFAALTTGLVVRANRSQRVGAAGLAGVAAIAGILAKPELLYLVPAFFFFLLPLWGRLKSLGTGFVLLGSALLAAVVGLAILPGRLHFFSEPWSRWPAFMNAFAAQDNLQWRRLFVSFWGRFGWGELALPAGVNGTLAAVGVLVVVLWLAALLRGEPAPRSTMLGLVAIPVSAMAAVLLYDFHVWAVSAVFVGQGRYLLPALPAAVIAALAGLQGAGGLAPLRRLSQRLVPVAVVTGALALNVVGLEVVWSRLYLA